MEKLEKLIIPNGQTQTNPKSDRQMTNLIWISPNLCKRQNNQDEFTTAFNQITIVMKEGINLFEDNDSFPVFDDDSEENNDL
ncbi:hypothetical protein GLOIN_2v1785604 [Rhizophagus irregularis DAOM 181602=DAOM 197198]|uniref:Uncharacterized protein n=1 Tax=Rhizophagus irregularis (strain DAOM 181602 / DAOM 197198 / MUCL 43194) TaxID=747089 RepID=A0A2P4P9Z1_RHIID|nr:hypothetical protein GLOIN_2v1785604 [Rhizophagus irregularis DAOM 181602=DAOM 197198]POG62209.1 hypothetical protein GLOIN_2v1785604 [Rhizophagus irregularis DAOM 181602=DAOM 197198]|eukprot:XP_025169075.1 hypothetical protein GLOIN_2v1785604 [Rhizophagus irregularis DAOM 181602=DAOM 197198]